MRTYSEQDVADIIARAAERQAARARTTERVGLTLDEIARLGADAGLDPEDLRAAAAEIDRGGLARQASHTDTTVVVERWVEAPLTDTAWEDAVALLRDHAGPSAAAVVGGHSGGTVQQVGRAYEWTHTSGLGIQTTATVSPRGDRTRVRISQLVGLASPRAEGIAYGGFLAVVVAVITAVVLGTAAGAAAPLVVLGTLAAFAATVAVAVPGTTALDRRWRVRKLDALETLADQLADVLSAPDSEAFPTASQPDAPLRDAFEALETDDAPLDGEPRAAEPRAQGRA